jgi:hypothetical protein
MKKKQEDKDWSLYMTSHEPLHLLGFVGHAHFLLAPFPGFRALACLCLHDLCAGLCCTKGSTELFIVQAQHPFIYAPCV